MKKLRMRPQKSADQTFIAAGRTKLYNGGEL